MKRKGTIGLMRVYPKAIVLTTKPHSNVRECIASLRGLVVRTITLGKTRIRAIKRLYCLKTLFIFSQETYEKDQKGRKRPVSEGRVTAVHQRRRCQMILSI